MARIRLATVVGIIALAALSACTAQPSNPATDGYSTSSDSSASSVSVASSVSSSSPTAASSSSSSSSSIMPTQAKQDLWDGTYLKGLHTVVLQTSKGNITIELNANAAPKTVTNFVTLAKSGYYDGLTFHRVIPGFMIQGGDPNGNGTGGKSIYGPQFDDEIAGAPALYKTGYKKGVVAMANAGPNTNGSQFFIMETDYPLPPNYTIFGEVTGGQDVVSAIAAVPRGTNDMPLEPVTFTVQVKN